MPLQRIDWDKKDVVRCDERGRATLGTEFAEEKVFVWIASIPNDPGIEPSDAEKKTLTRMATWAKEHVDEWLFDGLRPREGIVRDKYGEEHETPYRYDPEDDELIERGEA